MAKLTLNTIGSRYGSIDALNDNFDAIEQAIENTLSLDGTSPNALEADLDMNNKDILNTGEINTSSLRINGTLVEPAGGVSVGVAFQTYSYIATAGQTSFSVAPAIPYTPSILVFVNGLQVFNVLVSGSNVVIPPRLAGDEVIIRRFTTDPFLTPTANEIETAKTVAITQAGIATTQAGVASSQATIAIAQATTATTQAATSVTQAGLATTARIGAEAARDATIIGAAPTVYATIAAGLAATASGNYFSVPSADSAEYLILYLDNAGVAVEIKRYPSTNALAQLKSTPVPGVVYAVQDSNDNASEYIEVNTGKHYATGLDANTVNGISRYRLNTSVQSKTALNLNSSIVHHISYGQSLALGNSTGIHTLVGADQDGFFDSVMFNANGTTYAGPRAQEGSGTVAQNHASLIPYLEQPLVGVTPTGNFETPLGNAFRTVKRLLRDEDNIVSTDFDYILLGSAPGQSNTTIAGLSKGQVPFTNLINDVTYGLIAAQTAGKSYSVDVIYWSQGEADISAGTPRATYLATLLQLYTDLNTDIKAITKQTHNIKIVMYQCSIYNQTNPNIALAQLDAAKVNTNIVLATSIYGFEHVNSTNVHLTGAGSAHLGGYYGLAAKRVAIDGSPWANLYPTRLTRQGTLLEIEFPDTGYPISASNTLFPSQSNYGLTAVQGDGITNNPILSVTVVGLRRIRILLTLAVSGYLRYGFSSWGGNLHNTCDINPNTAKNYTLYRPVLTFEEAFA